MAAYITVTILGNGIPHFGCTGGTGDEKMLSLKIVDYLRDSVKPLWEKWYEDMDGYTMSYFIEPPRKQLPEG
jgi:hypothetical protein